jgi:HK97 family phage prohead protease
MGKLSDMTRAHSILNFKSVDSEQRVIKGMATTPETDRMGDIVDPLGAQFGKDIPLLWQHDKTKPVGFVKFGTPTEKGIPFTAQIPVIDEPGTLKDRVDEAWQSVKAGLVRAVSIGFRALDSQRIKGGMRFTKFEILELSLVTIPANSQALIGEIRAIDQAQRKGAVSLTRDSGHSGSVKLRTPRKAVEQVAVKLVQQPERYQW